MNVNWQNLSVAIQRGRIAYNESGLGTPVDSGGIGIYDQPISDFSNNEIEKSRSNPRVFVYGFSKWGQGDRIKK